MTCLRADTWVAASFSVFFGCTNRTHPTPLHEVSATLELVAKSPLQTNTLCASIEPEHAKDECVLMGVEKLSREDVSTAESLCSTLTLNSTARGECWFRLAERHDNAEFCTQAEPFDFDCTMHLLSRWLFRHPETGWDEMIDRAHLYGVDSTSKEGATLLYRHVLSLKQPMRLHVCLDLPNPKACERAATSIYRDRLRFVEHQGTFPCIIDDDHPLSHTNQSTLHLIYTEFYDVNCSN